MGQDPFKAGGRFPGRVMFYNPMRKHIRNRMLSPIEFERWHNVITEDLWKTRDYSVHVISEAPTLMGRTYH